MSNRETNFDRITESPETLAKETNVKMGTRKYYALLLQARGMKFYFHTREAAVAATIEYLNRRLTK